MGDHGGGQAELSKLVEAMESKYGPPGTHLPLSNHAISDTSIMLYLQPGREQWVRNIYKTTSAIRCCLLASSLIRKCLD